MPRIVGKAGALYIDVSGTWAYVADLYDWEVNVEFIVLDASIKGDGQTRYVASHQQGRLTAKRWVEQGGIFFFGEKINSGQRFDWAVVTIDPGAFSGGFNSNTFSTNANPKVQGAGYFVRSQMHAPRGLVEDNMEIAIDVLVSTT